MLILSRKNDAIDDLNHFREQKVCKAISRSGTGPYSVVGEKRRMLQKTRNKVFQNKLKELQGLGVDGLRSKDTLTVGYLTRIDGIESILKLM